MSNVIAKQWWQSKTVWVNVITFAVALLALLANEELFSPWVAYIVPVQAVLNLILRFLTDKPIVGTGNGKVKTWLLLLVPALVLAPAFASTAIARDGVIVVKNLSPGQHVLILEVSDDGSMEVRRPAIVGTVTDGPTTQPPTKPPAGGLEAATKKALAAVPDHEKKALTAEAVSGIFREIGKQHSEGNLPTDELFPTLDKALDTVLDALGVSDEWAGFRESIKDAINAEQLTPDEVQPAFDTIADGLTNDNAALIDIAPHVAALIRAILAKDQAAIVQAVIQIVIALVDL